MSQAISRAFTLVEILIVVVILGILAAIVTPALVGATEESAISATYTDLQKIRRAVEVYRARHQELPAIFAGDAGAQWEQGEGPWGELVNRDSGQYFREAPTNSYVGGAFSRLVQVQPNAVPDAAWHSNYGWIFDPVTGDVLAAGFDGEDKPLPRPN